MESAERHLSPEEIICAVKQLSLPELEHLVEQMIALQAAKRAPHLSDDETALLVRINQGLPIERRSRLRQLTARKEAEEFSPTEQAELTDLTDHLEELQAVRVEALAELARLRGIKLDVLMDQLGIHFPDHD